MPQSMINFRMEESLKKKMEQTCKELGLSMSSAFTVFAKKVTRENRIPFDVSIDPFYSKKNIEVLGERVKAVETGKAKFIIKTMEELEAMENE